MNFRRWWLQKPTLEFADEMYAEARTRPIDASTFPVLKTDIPVYVFTEGELERFGEFVFQSGLLSSAANVPFKNIWHELTNDKVEEEL